MSVPAFLTPISDEIERRDQRLDLLKRQLSAAYDRVDYARAEVLSAEITRVRAEREQLHQAQESIAASFQALLDGLSGSDGTGEHGK